MGQPGLFSELGFISWRSTDPKAPTKESKILHDSHTKTVVIEAAGTVYTAFRAYCNKQRAERFANHIHKNEKLSCEDIQDAALFIVSRLAPYIRLHHKSIIVFEGSFQDKTDGPAAWSRKQNALKVLFLRQIFP